VQEDRARFAKAAAQRREKGNTHFGPVEPPCGYYEGIKLNQQKEVAWNLKLQTSMRRESEQITEERELAIAKMRLEAN
jgi:hypothetical protein